MKYFAVTGNPILHSKSPNLFNGAYPAQSGNFAYFRLAAQSGEEALELFHELGLAGMNVTAPFKQDMVRLSDYCSEEAKVLNAANTLVLKDGTINAYNTDIYGVGNAIKTKGVDISNKKCLVVGAGGAGCAAAYALHMEGGNVTIVNRTVEKAKKFADTIGCAYAGLDDNLSNLVAYSDILVNTLYANIDIIDELWITPQHVILDAIYHGSKLRQKAENMCATYIDGGQWLIHQGLPAYQMFTDMEPDAKGVENALLSTSEKPKHISFIGFMGAGKSTVAPMVAEMLGLPEIDADRLLESRFRESIPQMIASKGEAYFREKELSIMQELLESDTPCVISCGGGAVTQPKIRELLQKNSMSIWLYASPKQCLSRINVASRPILAKHDNPEQAAKDIFEERKALYAKTAWLLVNTNNRSAKEVSQIVYDEVSKCIRG